MHEPNEELIEQIAKEHWQALLPEQAWRTGGGFEKAFIAVAKETISCPTIRKALELYENQPKWQDKPDKEGWWWINLWPTNWAIEVITKRGDPTLRVRAGYFTTFLPPEPDVDAFMEYLGRKLKWLYIPEPEPYKGEE